MNILDDPTDKNVVYLSMLLTMDDFLGASKRRASCSLIFCTSLSSYRGFLAVLSDASSTALFTYKISIIQSVSGMEQLEACSNHLWLLSKLLITMMTRIIIHLAVQLTLHHCTVH